MNSSSAHDRNEDPIEDFEILSHASVHQLPQVASIPLPTDLPPVPNLSSLPAHILHSGTVETLIGQNEDLMARLKVNLRRNSILEEQIMEQDRIHSQLRGEHASLLAQFQVVEEKSAMLKSKSQTFDVQIEELRDQLAFEQARVEAAEERSQELRAGLRFEKTFRRRVRNWVRPYIDSLKAQVTDSVARVAFLDRQLSTREAVIGDLRERITQLERAQQNAAVKTNHDQALLVSSYEARLTKAEGEMAKSKAEASLLREKAGRLDEAVKAQTTAENRIILLERKLSEMETQVAAYRVEAKTLAAESMMANTEKDRAARAEKEACDELARVRDQFESLQAVWSEAQKKFEASQLQQDALNKLNQELSRQLKIERQARETSTARAAAEKPADRIEKIESLLAELESGFTKTRAVDGLDFVESKNEAREASL